MQNTSLWIVSYFSTTELFLWDKLEPTLAVWAIAPWKRLKPLSEKWV